MGFGLRRSATKPQAQTLQTQNPTLLAVGFRVPDTKGARSLNNPARANGESDAACS